MMQLCEATITGLSDVTLPVYKRSLITPGILHLGAGNFHRAHQAIYTEDILNTDPTWGIVGVGLQSTTAHDRLAPQDYLYSVCERLGERENHRVIGSLLKVLTLAHERDALFELVRSPAIQVITLTITEKGYCHDTVGGLDLADPLIQHDLLHPDHAASAPGVLTALLHARMEADSGPITVVSCDNLAENGSVTLNVVRQMAARMHPGLEVWVEKHAAFPSTVVDRIVPRTTSEAIQNHSPAGYRDEGLIVTEPFKQWVIQDTFAGRRPPWDLAGAQFVEDVRPFETVKLRMLNATHSTLAYLGLIAGYDFVHEAIKDRAIEQFASQLIVEEIMPFIDAPAGFRLDDYQASILERFVNDAIAYGVAQVATDGSEKLPQRILPTIKKHLETGTVPGRLTLVVAAWLHCLHDEKLSERFTDPLQQLPPLSSLGGRKDLLGELAHDSQFVSEVDRWITRLATEPFYSLLLEAGAG